MQPIVRAVFNNKTEKLRELLAQGEDANGVDEQRASLMCICVFRGHLECLRILLDHGANPNTPDALLQAARAEDQDFLRTLLESGADPNTRTERTNSPIISAIERNNGEAFDLLVQFGAELTEARCGQSPLASAAAAGNNAALAYLVTNAALPKNDVTKAIRQATINGHVECLEKLLPLSNLREDDHLRFAVWNRQIGTARLLLRHGANPNLQDEDGNTALWHAENERDPAMVALLKEFGAEDNEKSTYSRSLDSEKEANTNKLNKLSEILEIPVGALASHLVQPLPEPVDIPAEIRSSLPDNYARILETTAEFRLFGMKAWDGFELWGVARIQSASLVTDALADGYFPVFGSEPHLTSIRLSDGAIVSTDWEDYQDDSFGEVIASNLKTYIRTLIHIWQAYDDLYGKDPDAMHSEWWHSYAASGARYDLDDDES